MTYAEINYYGKTVAERTKSDSERLKQVDAAIAECEGHLATLKKQREEIRTAVIQVNPLKKAYETRLVVTHEDGTKEDVNSADEFAPPPPEPEVGRYVAETENGDWVFEARLKSNKMVALDYYGE